MRVVYETFDIHAVEKIVQTTLRAIIGDIGMNLGVSRRYESTENLHTKNCQELGHVDHTG